MIRCNHASFSRAMALGALLASTVTLFACGATHNMPVSTMPGGTMPGGTMPGQSPHPMSHPRPHPWHVRLKRLVWCWCLVKQIYGALIGADALRLNSGATGKHLPKGCFGLFFFALEPPKESGIGGYMPSYIVTAYCEKCSANHPTGVELNWPEQISPNKSIKEVFEGTFLPPEIAMMSRNYFLCPQTGKINKQTDSTKTFLAEMK